MTMTYDHWKTTEPDDASLVCEICGARLRKDRHSGRLYCETCDPEEEPADELARQILKYLAELDAPARDL